MSFSIYTSAALLNYMFGKTSDFGTQPTIYIALSKADPTDNGSGLDEPGDTYARQLHAAAGWVAATSADPSVITNATAVTFPTAGASWGTITHFALYTAVTGGTCLGSSSLTTDKTPTDGDTPSFAIGELDITLT